jgi:2'-5' RNA ligase
MPYAIVLPIKSKELSTLQLQAQQQFQILKAPEENIHITLCVGLDDSSQEMVKEILATLKLPQLTLTFNELGTFDNSLSGAQTLHANLDESSKNKLRQVQGMIIKLLDTQGIHYNNKFLGGDWEPHATLFLNTIINPQKIIDQVKFDKCTARVTTIEGSRKNYKEQAEELIFKIDLTPSSAQFKHRFLSTSVPAVVKDEANCTCVLS